MSMDKAVHVAVAVVMGASSLLGVDRTWDGGANDGVWGTAKNWSDDTLPGPDDRAIISTTALPSDKRIRLRGDPIIQSLAFTDTGNPAILDGEGSNTLTLASGNIAGGSGAVNGVIGCDVILGASGSWSAPDVFGAVISCYGNVTDNGAGHSLAFAGGDKRSVFLGGHWNIGGRMTVNCRSVTIGGLYTNAEGLVSYGGSITNATGLYLDARTLNNNDTTLTIDNTYEGDSDRIQADVAVGTLRSGGIFELKGHSAVAVNERVSKLDLQAGKMSIAVRGKQSTVGTDLIFGNVTRVPGATMSLVVSSGGRMIVEGANNTNGIWQPWCFMRDAASVGCYSKVDASNAIIATVNADYLAPAASGNDATKLYRFSDASLTLAEATAMWGLRWDGAVDQTLNLGAHDLVIGSGSMIIGGSLGKTVSSAGGRLVFGGEDIVFDINGVATCSIGAPLMWSRPAGSAVTRPSLIFSRGMCASGVVLDGADLIGDYDSLYSDSYFNSAIRSVVLGGPDDRTFHGPLRGYFHLEKQGLGTLTLKGEEQRRYGLMTAVEGCVVLAHSNAPSLTVLTNAICEVAEGITLSSGVTITVQTNAVLRGLGTTAVVTLQSGARIAPGVANKIGTLTLGVNSVLPTNGVLDVRLGFNTNDMLLVNGKLTLPATGAPLRLSVSDVSGGEEQVNGKSYVVAYWSGSNPATVPVWQVVTPTPGRLDVSNATVSVDLSQKRIVLSGVKPATRGTLIKMF